VQRILREGTIVCKGESKGGVLCRVRWQGRVGFFVAGIQWRGSYSTVGEGLCCIQYFYLGSAKSHGPFLQQVA